MDSRLLDKYAETLRPKRDEPIYEWARSAVRLDNTSPIPGGYQIENSLYLKEPFDAFKDDEVRKVTTIGPNQGGRTKAMEIASLWSIARRPGPLMWNTFTNEKADQFAAARWWPMARSSEEVAAKLPTDPRLIFPTHFILKDGMDVHIQGANEGNLQEKSIMTQFNDELFQWPSGMLNEAWKRCDVSYAWNYKVWNGSVADQEGDEADMAYLDGDRRQWHIPCLKCGKYQRPLWKQLRWESNSRTRPSADVYNFRELAKTVRYECAECGHPHSDTHSTRRRWNERGQYMPEKGEAIQLENGSFFHPYAITHASFRWNILCVNWPGITWAQWAEEFIKATLAFRRTGNSRPLHLFWSRRMAEPFSESQHLESRTRIIVSDYKLGQPNFYIANKWQDEYARFMGCDKQEVGYPYVIRAAKKAGESRLIDCGDADSYDELEATAARFGVKPQCVLIDSGYETRQVYAACLKRGWTFFKGADRDGFDHILETNGRRVVVNRPYSGIKWGDAMIEGKMTSKDAVGYNPRVGHAQAAMTARFARGYHFSNLAVKDLLAALKQGRTSTYWGVPQDVAEGYLAQMNSEVRYKIVSARGRVTYWWSNAGIDGKAKKKPNHWWDCEALITCALVMQGILRIEPWGSEEGERGDVPSEPESIFYLDTREKGDT